MKPSDLPDLPLWLPVAVDTETNGLWADSGARVSIVSLAWVDPETVMGDPEGLIRAIETGEGVTDVAYPFAQGPWGKEDSGEDLFSDQETNPNLGWGEWMHLLAWLLKRRHVYHNGKFDVEKLRYAPIGWDGAGVDFINNWEWDTQVACPDIWPQEPSGLKPTAARLWGADSTAEAEALKAHLGPQTDPRYDLVPWEVIGPYAAKDTNLTIRLYYHQMFKMGLIDRDGRFPFGTVNETLYRHVRREIAVAKNLYRMERAGIPFDAAGSRSAASVLRSRKEEIELMLPFRATDPQAKQYFFGSGKMKGTRGLVDCLDLVPYSLTDTGNPQFTADTVTQVCADFGPETETGRVARLWAERQKLATANKMWYEPYATGLGSDGRLRTCFRQVTRGRGNDDGGTRSGRFSVERVNLQAIPHDYRLVAGEEKDWKVPTPRQLIGSAAAKLTGWELWEFDLAQAELRLAAAWSGCDRMLDAMREGRDLHGETTRELFGVTPDSPTWGMYRQIGKRANFTLCFGAGGKTLAKMVQKETGMRMSEREGAKIVKDWNAIYPEYHAVIDYWSQVAEHQLYVPLAGIDGYATGRLRRFSQEERAHGLHKAFNQLVQGSLGEFARDWNLNTERICDEHGLGFVEGVGWTGLCLIIHDSQVILLPAGKRGEAIADELVEGARTLWDRYFNTPDPEGRVRAIEGYAEGKRW